MKRYYITIECDHCNSIIKNGTLDLTDGDDIEIPLFTLSQIQFRCDKCGAEYGTGDIDVMEYEPPHPNWEAEAEDE